jgi:uncharacterized protein
MTWRDKFTPSGDVDDRRPGAKKTKYTPPTKAQSGLIALLIGMPIIALGLGWCGFHAQPPAPPPTPITVPADDLGRFYADVYGDIQRVWREILGPEYRPAELVLFTGSTPSGCGGRASTAQGPFYCPDDQKIYIAPAFFRELNQTKACRSKSLEQCEFTRAIVVAHEHGHHIQNITGIMGRHGGGGSGPNSEGVHIELQADCYAGVWLNHTNSRWHNVTDADLAAALETAQAFGDDTLGASPSEFTHGSAKQRMAWVSTGWKFGDMAHCNTWASGP